MWAVNWKQQYGDWAAIPIIGLLQPEWYGLPGPSKLLAKLTLVLGLDEVYMWHCMEHPVPWVYRCYITLVFIWSF